MVTLDNYGTRVERGSRRRRPGMADPDASGRRPVLGIVAVCRR
jgi:hypothetical protein